MFCLWLWDGSNKWFADVVVALEDELILRTSPSGSKRMISILVSISQSFLSPSSNPVWVVPCEGARLPDPRTFGGNDRRQQPTSHSGAPERDVRCIHRSKQFANFGNFWDSSVCVFVILNRNMCLGFWMFWINQHCNTPVDFVFCDFWGLCNHGLRVVLGLAVPWCGRSSAIARATQLWASQHEIPRQFPDEKHNFTTHPESNNQGCAAPHEYSTLACQQVHANSLQAGIIWDVLVAFATICRARRCSNMRKKSFINETHDRLSCDK